MDFQQMAKSTMPASMSSAVSMIANIKLYTGCVYLCDVFPP